MLALAVAVGLVTGLLAAALIGVIRVVQDVAFGESVSWRTLIAVPTGGAFVVGLLVHYVIPESAGGGIVELLARLSTHRGRIRRRVPLGAVLASGLALGTGGAGGREGPIVLIGGGVGSVIGQLFAVGDERLRTLVAAGVAAGIGASFNAPIGGMLFAVELIIGAFRRSALQSVVVASVVSSLTARAVIGPEIIYEPATPDTFNDPRELLLYALVGVAAALFGLGFLFGEDIARRAFGRVTLWPPMKLAIGGLTVGLIALAVPEVIGTGDDLPPIHGFREPIQSMIDGRIGVGYPAVGLLLLFAVAKLAATCISVGSGNAVGTFAPALFTGAALGGAVGHVAAMLVPTAAPQPGAFALVGMAAVFAAAARMPLTAIVIAVELTNGYGLVLPLMVAAGLATIVAGHVHPESVYTLPLRKRGVLYTESSDVALTRVVRVGEVMSTKPDTLAADLPLERAREELHRRHRPSMPVVDHGRLIGIVTLDDLLLADAVVQQEGRNRSTGPLVLTDLDMRHPRTVTPDDSAASALGLMAASDVGWLPVVSADGHSLMGSVGLSNVIKASHQVAASPGTALQRIKMQHPSSIPEIRFVEFRIAENAPAAGQRVGSVSWPGCSTVAVIRRGHHAMFPDGDTELRAGDQVTVLTTHSRVGQVQRLFAG